MTSASLGHQLDDLFRVERRKWEELWGLVQSLDLRQRERRGYFADDDWSVKDMVAHIGTWMAEAAAIIAQVRANTHRPEELDIDAMNARFLAAMRDMEWKVVETQCLASRGQMLGALRQLPEMNETAEAWVRKAGPDHYEEHLPRLREWVGELRG